jgi:hypothetical protein
MNRESCEVTGGLRDGELLVLTNPAMLADRLPVRRTTMAPVASPLGEAGRDSLADVSGRSPMRQEDDQVSITGEQAPRLSGMESGPGEVAP